ncbi:MAG: hypothetical protein HKN17_03000 [Rhodothermales bacterium]|nr:hypothetical protein [Rhodothermales bacterium]
MELLFPIGLVFVGVLLIVVEVYLIPGFNVAGITGAAVILFAVGLAFSDAGAFGGVITLLAAIVLSVGTFTWMWRSGAWDRFVLETNLKRDDDDVARESENRSKYLGRSGIALTPLRPTGVAEIDGDRIEVVTEGDFIASGSRIKVVAMDRRRYFVRLSSEDGKPVPAA